VQVHPEIRHVHKLLDINRRAGQVLLHLVGKASNNDGDYR
jgi:hypothetical protein